MQLLGLLRFTLEIYPWVKRFYARQVMQVTIINQYLNHVREAHLTLFLREDLLQNLIHGARSKLFLRLGRLSFIQPFRACAVATIDAHLAGRAL